MTTLESTLCEAIPQDATPEEVSSALRTSIGIGVALVYAARQLRETGKADCTRLEGLLSDALDNTPGSLRVAEQLDSSIDLWRALHGWALYFRAEEQQKDQDAWTRTISRKLFS